jgi:hypothetical protein
VDCSPDEIERVRDLSQHVRAAAGERLIVEGEAGERLYVLISGALRVHSTKGLDHELAPGDVVGELAMLGGEPASADVTAIVPSDLLEIQASAVPALLRIGPVAHRLRAIGGARLVAPAAVAVEARSVPVVRPRPVVRGVGAGMYARTEVPVRPVRAVVLTGIVVLLCLLGAWVMAERNATTLVGLDDILADARTGEGLPPAVPIDASAGTSDTSDVVGETHVSDTDAPGTHGSPTEPAPTAAAPMNPSADQPVPEPGSASSTATDDPVSAAPRFRPPAAGVYSYATTGGERINLVGARHQYPAETHAIIRHTGGCGWSSEHRVLEEHVDLHDRCSSDEAVLVLADGREVEFFGQRDGLMYHCDPPALALWDTPDGSVTTGTCSTSDGESDAHYETTFVGLQLLEVGGESVETAHVHLEFEMTGSSRGTSTVDFWLHPETGLIVRQERVVDTYARAVWGDVRYQEEATFHLLSLTPRT